MVTKKKQKVVGKYIVLLMEWWETGGYNGKPRFFKDAEVSVHLKGKEKGLQRRENYASYGEARRVYSSLNTQKKIEEWIRSE